MARRPTPPDRKPQARKPDRHADAINRAMLAHSRGDRAAALDALRRVIAADPRHAQAHRLAAFVLHDARDYERALYHAEKAVACNPAGSQPLTMLGMVLNAVGRGEEALDAMQRAVEKNPRDAEAWSTLGLALSERERHDEATAAHRRALAINPAHWPAGMNAAISLLASARPRDAADLLRRLADEHPGNAHLAQRLAFTLNYDDRATRADINAAHRAWGAIVERTIPLAPPPPRREGGPVRIALLSADLRSHSCAHFVPSLLEHLDRDRFEVHAISTTARPDDTTGRLRALADHWHDDAHLAEPALADHIRALGIDVLVECNGHTSGSRLGVLARRPAPVQVTWLGYPATTGLSRIDARFIDSLTDPPEVDHASVSETERLVRLDPCFLCYTPPADAPEPAGTPPCTHGAPFTFASFNDAKKISPAAFELWARVMERVDRSRLLLKCGALASDAIRAHALDTFQSHGIDPERIELAGHTPGIADHLATYRRVDLALDTFPYHGTTTTCEALWMGVPVVTRVGETHAARVGLSLLSAIGLFELAATDDDRFVELASSLANDRGRLADLRAGLRARVAGSPLTDAPAFARRFAHACLGLVPTR